MPLIYWNDSFSVDVKIIDKQHQGLIAVFNQLFDAMQLGQGKDVSGKILNDLINYTKTHFKTEEKYFDQFGYPEANTHKNEHAVFVRKVSEFKKEFEEDNTHLSIELMHFLNDWLKNHIKGTDKKYSQFFHKNGLR